MKNSYKLWTKAGLSALSSDLDTLQKRCTARTIDTDVIVDSLSRYMAALRISKTAAVGVKVTVDPNAQNFPNAYKYMPESTLFDAEYTAKGWIVSNIRRGTTHRAAGTYHATLPDKAKAAILERFEYCTL